MYFYSFGFTFIHRTSIFLFTSVSSTGSSGELRHGEKHPQIPQNISENALHWCRLFCSNPPVPRTSTNNHVQVEASSSRTEGAGSGRRRRRRRTRHQHGQTPPSDQPQSRVQQILNPGNLLRRLLPSSLLFNSDSHPSWKQSWTKPCFANKTVETAIPAVCR